MGVEYELKFKATEDILQRLEKGVTGSREVYRMQTSYYDTPTAQLSARHFTLRKRMENDRAVCTLKAPLPDGSRGEWETECDNICDAVEKLCKLGAPKALPVLTAEGLQNICGAKFTRLAITVTLENCTVELALDKGILTGGDRELPLCEVEVELKAGSRAACDAYAKRLAEEYGLQIERSSKFRRALGLYQGE